MRIIVFATRLAGTDGVSLETAKMRALLERLGHEVHYCAGELEPGQRRAHLVREMHFTDPAALELGERAFGGGAADPALDQVIARRATEIGSRLTEVVAAVQPALLVVQNAWAIPMQLPLALALARLVEQSGLPTLAHNHDYWWERERFAENRVPSLLERCFPFAGERVVHLSINSAAQGELLRRRGIDSLLLPNVMDFDEQPPGLDAYNADLRHTLGLAPDRPLLLQPTRVVRRKGIELAIELAARLGDLRPLLVITHGAGDEGLDYLEQIRQQAAAEEVDLRHVAERIADQRLQRETAKVYSLWDAYPHAQLVTYPSLYEGFGNALLEAVWFGRPVLVNRYAVYVEDIAPKGFRFVEIDGAIDDGAVDQVRALLDPRREDERRAITAHNYQVAREHFGFATLERVLGQALERLGLALSK